MEQPSGRRRNHLQSVSWDNLSQHLKKRKMTSETSFYDANKAKNIHHNLVSSPKMFSPIPSTSKDVTIVHGNVLSFVRTPRDHVTHTDYQDDDVQIIEDNCEVIVIDSDDDSCGHCTKHKHVPKINRHDKIITKADINISYKLNDRNAHVPTVQATVYQNISKINQPKNITPGDHLQSPVQTSWDINKNDQTATFQDSIQQPVNNLDGSVDLINNVNWVDGNMHATAKVNDSNYNTETTEALKLTIGSNYLADHNNYSGLTEVNINDRNHNTGTTYQNVASNHHAAINYDLNDINEVISSDLKRYTFTSARENLNQRLMSFHSLLQNYNEFSSSNLMLQCAPSVYGDTNNINIVKESPTAHRNNSIMSSENMDNTQNTDATNSRKLQNSGLGECPICCDDMKTDNIASTKCGHIFCFTCLKIATKHSSLCPICRAKVNKRNYFRLFLSN